MYMFVSTTVSVVNKDRIFGNILQNATKTKQLYTVTGKKTPPPP